MVTPRKLMWQFFRALRGGTLPGDGYLRSGESFFGAENEVAASLVFTALLERMPEMGTTFYISHAQNVMERFGCALTFWRRLRDECGIKSIQVVSRERYAYWIICEGKNEVLWSPEFQKESVGGSDYFCIPRGYSSCDKSRTARKLRRLMNDLHVDRLIFMDGEGSSGVSAVIGGWCCESSLPFGSWSIDSIIEATYQSALDWILTDLQNCQRLLPACDSVTTDHSTLPVAPDLSNFDTDVNPCEVGYESF